MVDISVDTKEAARAIVGLIDGFKIMHVRDPLLPREASLEMVELVIIRFLSPRERHRRIATNGPASTPQPGCPWRCGIVADRRCVRYR